MKKYEVMFSSVYFNLWFIGVKGEPDIRCTWCYEEEGIHVSLTYCHSCCGAVHNRCMLRKQATAELLINTCFECLTEDP